MSLTSDAKHAREVHKQIESLVKLQGKSDIRLAEHLYEIKKKNLYKKAVGEGINTWADYLRQPEVNISLYRAEKLLKVYEHLIETLNYLPEQLEGIPLYALHYIAKREMFDTDVVDSLLADAACLSERDFKERFHDETTTGERTYTFLIMRKCVETGRMEKVHAILSDDIKNKFNLI